ncbi:zinc-dependent alcohol dehydrogenase family protein [Conexibacter arvalis]|uniref:NADPH2:quinone reductase n=1 Tax=Conexibacter arvalis TaxID=912552 RepID=A0A840IEG7_9ACTN|nr:zinc-dependent alcohol dehydrogenase family protein [Conexibacter arvalis]MBB4662408.1 NADPH2:quinone reductase [Conexibacter arvalis]
MKAVVLAAPGQIEVRTLPDPAPARDQVVVRVHACGICGSDLQLVDGTLAGAAYPFVPGHELAGEVVAVGADVADLRVGDRVAADPSLPCGTCAPCRRGAVNLCRRFGVIGASVDGGFAEYVALPARNAYVLPEQVSYAAGALLEPFACVVHGFQRLAPPAGSAFLVVGAGAIGLMLLELALRTAPAEVVAVERHAERRAVAERLGARAHATVAEALATRPEGFDCVVDATGVPAAVEEAFDTVAPGGRLLLFGVARASDRVRLAPYRIYRDEITVLGSMSVGHAFAPALELVAGGAFELERLVTHTVGLEGFAEAVELLRRGEALKTHVIPSLVDGSGAASAR